ncbi:sulfotransferase domain-containing protein [Roseovarius sp. A21]|uniref:Sulfotransferase domain-containing protein n=1 Tax=Roseovarius bejariae TaxID=2576383 RepID=A0A844CQD8_9RHOB|nr:sulfotransferase domain-containing protein [Roseovarius bejariae]MRU15685.1 sulfotransferase domain-containing protein [Roseovarius bejariae]
MSRPNFFIVGAPKCGTTAWAYYLSGHADICFSKNKEPHYFSTDFDGFRWARCEEDYLSFFEGCECERVIAEASVQYLYSADAARNIAAFNPDARILVMLRRPSAFIRSYHNQLLLNFDETIEDLQTAWDLSGHRCSSSIPAENREPSFLNYKRVGLFSEQLARYFEYFDRSQIKVTFMEDWIQKPRGLYLDLMEFLMIDDDGRTDFSRVHAAKHVSSRMLHRITQRPPFALKKAVGLIKRIPGMEDFKPSHILRKINTRRGYSSSEFNTELAEKIDLYFAEDQARLQKMLER